MGKFMRLGSFGGHPLKKKRNFEELTQKKDKPDLPVGLLKVINL
jgi:hypothetical protein